LPHILGKDGSGKVVWVGKQVKKFKIGDEVCGSLSQFNPIQGTYAEYCVFGEDNLIHKPKNLSHHFCASISLSGVAAYESIVVLGKVKEGDKVFINGGKFNN
jgi:alcohol dehydrogenase